MRLINSEFVRATLSYNNSLIFNDISIRIAEDQLEEFVTFNDACFAKVLLLAHAFLNDKHKGLKLALIQWYDFKHINDKSKWVRLDCPYMKMTVYII